MLVRAMTTFVVLAFLSLPLSAAPIVTIGAGSAVSSVDRSATFSSLTSNGIPLGNYTEGNLRVATNGFSYQGFNPFVDGVPSDGTTAFYYDDGGSTSFVTITGTDDAVFSGLEFQVGDGFYFGSPNTRVTWEMYLNGAITGFGSTILPQGAIIGFFDPTGFDELRVAGDDGSYAGVSLSFGDAQAIALDNLVAQVLVQEVPEPASLALWGISSMGLAWCARRRMKRAER